MLKRHADRFGHHDIRVGDMLHLPDDLPRPLGARVPPAARHGKCEVIAFPVYGDTDPGYPGLRPMAHCITVRRLRDNAIATISAWIWERCREAYGVL